MQYIKNKDYEYIMQKYATKSQAANLVGGYNGRRKIQA